MPFLPETLAILALVFGAATVIVGVVAWKALDGRKAAEDDRKVSRKWGAESARKLTEYKKALAKAQEHIAALEHASMRRVPQPPPAARVPSTHVPVTHQPRHGAAAQVPVSAVPPVIGEALEELTRAADTTGVIPAILGGEMPSEDADLYEARTGRRIGWGDVA